MELKGTEAIKERLQHKREQYMHQKEKSEQMKCTMQKTEEEIEQLEYIFNEMEHIEDTNRAPQIIPNDKVGETFAHLCQIFDYLQHRYKLFLSIGWHVKWCVHVINSGVGRTFPDVNISVLLPC